MNFNAILPILKITFLLIYVPPMSSGCCRSALFLFPKKMFWLFVPTFKNLKLHNDIADFAEESAQ